MKLDALPHSVPQELLNLGLIVTLPEIDGTPLRVDGQIIDPMMQTSYKGEYRGRQYAECVTSLLVSEANKVYFDVNYLNGPIPILDESAGHGHGHGHGHGKKKH